mgnify:CR=1 FL=1
MAYSQYSPYGNTPSNSNGYLGILRPRPISAAVNDQVLTINATYEYRPDLLANDLYDNPKLWWVFAQRNPNIIKDPIFDMRKGINIFLPEQERLFNDLGI